MKAKPIHPGVTLLEDFLRPLGLSANRVALDLHISTSRVIAICKGERAITADTALRLARYFETSPEFWLRLQLGYDLAVAEEALRGELKRITPH